MKQKNSEIPTSDSNVVGIRSLDFIEKVSRHIMSTLYDPERNIPAEARDQWVEMSQNERIAFVNAGLECFYWIYIARGQKHDPEARLYWENSTTEQKVETAAGFCSYILGTECQHEYHDEMLSMEASPSEWVN